MHIIYIIHCISGEARERARGFSYPKIQGERWTVFPIVGSGIDEPARSATGISRGDICGESRPQTIEGILSSL